MSVILEAVERGRIGGDLYLVRCDNCQRVFETVGSPHAITRRKCCQKCRTRSNQFSKMTPEQRRLFGSAGGRARWANQKVGAT